METWDAITSRRNVREFEDRPLSDEQVERILEAGRRAPSSRNWQPWDFIAVTDREHLRELSGVWQGGGHIAGCALAVVVIVESEGEQPRERAIFDVGQASMQMMLAAADLGVGSGHSAVGDQELARQILGFPEDRFAYIIIDFGFPGDRPLRPIKRPNRRPFNQVVHTGRW